MSPRSVLMCAPVRSKKVSGDAALRPG
jgi:hypothetical protein